VDREFIKAAIALAAIQFAGTTAMVLLGYCFLAHCLSRLPFSRVEPLTGRLKVSCPK